MLLVLTVLSSIICSVGSLYVVAIIGYCTFTTHRIQDAINKVDRVLALCAYLVATTFLLTSGAML